MKNIMYKLNLGDVLEKLVERPIELIDERQFLTPEELMEKYPGKTVYVCDAYVNGIEEGVMENGALRFGNVISIDHHSSLDEFARKISSVNLAIQRVEKMGIAPKNSVVIIHHTDFDSIVSSLVIRGIFPPEQFLGKLAVMADHTGESEEMVDLLQSMSEAHDLEFSLRNLQLWLDGRPLETKAKQMLKNLRDERRKAEDAVESGIFRNIEGVFYATLAKKIESAYFLPLLPEAKIILTFSPHRKIEGVWEAKTRLGKRAPFGLRLNELGIDKIDPSWGGRWNAGSNKRGNGTKIPIENYAKLLNEKLEKFANNDDL